MSKIAKMKITESEEHGRTMVIKTTDGVLMIVPVEGSAQAILDEYAATQDMAVLETLLDVDLGNARAKEAVRTKLEKISRCLSCDGMHVFYDGASFEKIKLDPTLESHLIKLMSARGTEAGERDFRAWARFAENLYGNVTPYIRGQLVTWLFAQNWLTFSEDGCIIGYRGGQINEEGGFAESRATGPGMVDGVIYNGHIPNPDGAIVEIDRSLVVDNPAVGCASGLHVGTFNYAKDWADGVVMRVKVDPRDVVNVPVDCNAQKIRCCRFEVLDHVNTRDADAADKFAEWGETWTYDDGCWGCGYDDELSDYEEAAWNAFDAYIDNGVPEELKEDWDMFFGDKAFKENVCEPELLDDEDVYDEWLSDVFGDAKNSYLNGSWERGAAVAKIGAWERLFGSVEAFKAKGCDEVAEAEETEEAFEVEENKTVEIPEVGE